MSDRLRNQLLIRILPGAADWKDAIRLSMQPLVETGCIEPRYPEAIIANTLEYGPYYIIVPDIALVHGRPDQGVRAAGFSLTRFQDPVFFPHTEEPVHLFLAMSADNDESHLLDMRAISELLRDEGAVECLRQAQTENELRRIFPDRC